ncbi:murein transglycosylase A [Sphingomonas radiodurans]|uniref:murein transglycosylase A n=1 Tax=Sphingomonas radiodurans TaxID=2890321 RepID=UPI001E4A5F50|nr:murein transglycosylase A [Sphingomonas radiodurans]WBH15964.1 murein transglycosylase A [Sphingomonas radiodurans]
MKTLRRVSTLAAALALSACVGGVAPPTAGPRVPPPTTTGAVRQPVSATPISPVAAATATGAITAATAGVVAGPPIASLPLTGDSAARALAAFRISCPSLVRRTDPTGLTRGSDWKPACDAAAGASGDPRGFFTRFFESVQVGDGKAFATGYYIPEIAGSREYRDGYAPIYARPTDLVDVDLGLFSTELKGKKIRGRVDGSNFVPYFDRTAIEQGALTGKARILGYAADPVELFFLQVQGSGLVRLPSGEILRIGYESQNGRDYTGIGKLMRDRGLLAPGQASMQGIVAWLHANPEQGRAIMRENKSYVFFRLLDGPPLGAMGLPVSDQATVAADTRFVPLGAPVFLSMDRTDATGLWVAQDTGGAIKGTNRFDTFWGAGAEARAIAGGMSARGTAFLLLPVGTLARLGVAQPRP